jgi:deazaflavin-dependent oxidoreductase (nitroreductase family)
VEASPFLYLTTRGWKTGRPHRIEIWFVELEGRFYVISEQGTRAHWAQNLKRDPDVAFRVGGRDYVGAARTLESEADAPVARRVQELFESQYGWNEGLIVELTPITGDEV